MSNPASSLLRRSAGHGLHSAATRGGTTRQTTNGVVGTHPVSPSGERKSGLLRSGCHVDPASLSPS